MADAHDSIVAELRHEAPFAERDGYHVTAERMTRAAALIDDLVERLAAAESALTETQRERDEWKAEADRSKWPKESAQEYFRLQRENPPLRARLDAQDETLRERDELLGDIGRFVALFDDRDHAAVLASIEAVLASPAAVPSVCRSPGHPPTQLTFREQLFVGGIAQRRLELVAVYVANQPAHMDGTAHQAVSEFVYASDALFAELAEANRKLAETREALRRIEQMGESTTNEFAFVARAALAVADEATPA